MPAPIPTQGPGSAKAAIPMIALAGEADTVIATRFYVCPGEVLSNHGGKRLAVLDRVANGWRFADAFGGNLVTTPRFLGDLDGVVRVSLGGERLAQSREGFGLELENGVLVLRELAKRSVVASEADGGWNTGQIWASDLELDGVSC
jgi:hypothetical protein